MNQEYYIIIEGRQTGPFSKDVLASQHINGETLVWRVGLPDWVKASSLPELSDILVVDTNYEDVSAHAESRWFAMINNQQVGPYTIDTLLSMGLNAYTPVWQNGMPDWVEAGTVAEIMRHLQSTPPPHNDPYGSRTQNDRQSSYGQYGAYGQNSQQQNFAYGGSNYGYNRGGYDNNGFNAPQSIHFNWLPYAIAATVVGFFFSCIGCIFGIIGIVNANKANANYAIGNDSLGDQANNTAKVMTIVGFVLAGIGLLATGVLWSGALTPFF